MYSAKVAVSGNDITEVLSMAAALLAQGEVGAGLDLGVACLKCFGEQDVTLGAGRMGTDIFYYRFTYSTHMVGQGPLLYE